MYVSVNIWFLCFVIAAVCCCIHVCSVTGEISQRKRRRRAKTTELKQLFSKNYLNSPGGFKVRPGFALFIPAQSGRIEMSRIAFYVQRARLSVVQLHKSNQPANKKLTQQRPFVSTKRKRGPARIRLAKPTPAEKESVKKLLSSPNPLLLTQTTIGKDTYVHTYTSVDVYPLTEKLELVCTASSVAILLKRGTLITTHDIKDTSDVPDCAVDTSFSEMQSVFQPHAWSILQNTSPPYSTW